MNGHRAREVRQHRQVRSREPYARSIAQHAADRAWFEERPDALWRVRRRVPTECDLAVGATHMLVVWFRKQDHWCGMPLTARDDADAYDQGAVEVVKLLLEAA